MKCVNDVLLNIDEPREAEFIYEGKSLCRQCLVAFHIGVNLIDMDYTKRFLAKPEIPASTTPTNDSKAGTFEESESTH